TLDDLGRYDLALGLYDRALPVIEDQAKPATFASWRTNAAITLANLGRHREAVAGYDEALPLLRSHGLPADVASCLTNRAGALQSLGRHQDAVNAYDPKEVNPSSLPSLDQIKYHGGFAAALNGAKQPAQALEQYTLCRRAMRRARQ